MIELSSRIESRMLLTGRLALYFAACSIPLVFCRETMYVFQLKTLILQYVGLFLATLMVIHQCVSNRAPNMLSRWLYRLIVLFVLWEVFKCWDSISPTVSWRQMSRIFWLPVIALSVPYFFRTRWHIERLITVIIWSALVVNFVAYVLYLPEVKYFFENKPSGVTTREFADFPIFGWIAKAIFYPEPFAEYLQEQNRMSLEKGREAMRFLPMSVYSIYPGKYDAGTFGSKNFITAYLNLTSILMVYRSVSWFISKKSEVYHYLFAIELIMVPMWSLYHIFDLGNRGSQIGWFFGSVALFAYIVWQLFRFKATRIVSVVLTSSVLFVVVLGTSVVYYNDPGRFISIFSFTSASNELRVHTWNSYYKSWAQDREHPGFENDAWRMSTGMGTYSFRMIYPKYRSKRIFQIEENQHNTETSHPHNEYLGYLGELGIIGLSLYFLMAAALTFYLIRLARKGDLQLIVLIGALVYAFVSVAAHQTVGVMVRYTGVAFQLWLILGIALALVNWKNEKKEPEETPSTPKTNPFPRFAFAAGLLVTVIIVMPNPMWPIRWMQSQHFYVMGHLYYGHVRNFAEALDKQKKQVAEYKKHYKEQVLDKGQRREDIEKQLNGFDESLRKGREEFKHFYLQASEYFKAGYEYDPANYESLYIGANMNVQFARTHLANNELKQAKEKYEEALANYDIIAEEAKYFVQNRYWQGVCYKGIGSYYYKKILKGDDVQKKLMFDNFDKAIKYFDLYIEQDVVYPDVYFEKFLIFSNTNQPLKALNELKKVLITKESGGYDLFNADNRYDTLQILNHFIQKAPSEEVALKALQLYALVQQYKRSTGLLPFVPKTERHIKNSLHFLPL